MYSDNTLNFKYCHFTVYLQVYFFPHKPELIYKETLL